MIARLEHRSQFTGDLPSIVEAAEIAGTIPLEIRDDIAEMIVGLHSVEDGEMDMFGHDDAPKNFDGRETLLYAGDIGGDDLA